MNYDLLQIAESAVTEAESKLAQLDVLVQTHSELTSNIESLSQQRNDVLAGDESDTRKVATMQKLDLTAEVRRSDLAKVADQIEEAKQAVIAAGISASQAIHTLKDNLIAAAKTAAKEVLLSVFDNSVVKLLEPYLNHAKAVKALAIDHLPFVGPDKTDHNLAMTARVRGQLETLKGNAPVPQTAAPAVVELVPAKENQLGALA